MFTIQSVIAAAAFAIFAMMVVYKFGIEKYVSKADKKTTIKVSAVVITTASCAYFIDAQLGLVFITSVITSVFLKNILLVNMNHPNGNGNVVDGIIIIAGTLFNGMMVYQNLDIAWGVIACVFIAALLNAKHKEVSKERQVVK